MKNFEESLRANAETYLHPSVVGKLPSLLEEDSANIYRFKPHALHLLARAFPSGTCAVASLYARTRSGSATLILRFESPNCCQTRAFKLTSNWERLEISLKCELGVSPTYLSAETCESKDLDVAICLAQCEEALFASPAIPPDTALPAIADENQTEFATRLEEKVNTDTALGAPHVDSVSSTSILICKPLAEPHQLRPTQMIGFLSFFSTDEDMELSVLASEKHSGRFIVRIRDGANERILPTSIFCGAQEYFLCVVFERNTLTLLVNETVALRLEVSRRTLFDKVYIGCTSRDAEALNGYVSRYMQADEPLILPRILEIFDEECPSAVRSARDYMNKYFKYAITTASERSTFDACIQNSAFSGFIKQLKFALPIVYEQFPPGKGFEEQEIRDFVWALTSNPANRSTRESYSKIGRTDLLSEFQKLDSGDQNQFRTEFKIWGRDGYKAAPSQPIKYMGTPDLCGAFVMVDRSKKARYESFQDIVRHCQDYPCVGIKEVPLVESNLLYFLSFHSDSRVRMKRMIINFYIHIPA